MKSSLLQAMRTAAEKRGLRLELASDGDTLLFLSRSSAQGDTIAALSLTGAYKNAQRLTEQSS